MHGDPEVRYVGELDGVVLSTLDCLGEVAANLGGVNVKGGDEFEVADVVATELDVHESGHVVPDLGVTVIRNTLN